MIKLSKFADYGIVLMTYIAGADDDHPVTARRLSSQSGLPLPTVSKILKSLCRAQVLVSQRGKQGGYSLSASADQISVADMIAAIDGPIALTACSVPAESDCDLEDSCPTSSNWQLITGAVVGALEKLTLADMKRPIPHPASAAAGRTHNLLELVRS